MAEILRDLASALSASAGEAATLTIDAPPEGQRQRVTQIEVVLYNAATRTGGGTPVFVATSGMGGLAMMFPSAGLVGTCERREYFLASPLDGQEKATEMKISCPATAGVIWHANAIYRNEEL